MQTLTTDAARAPEYGEPHHQVLRREPLFVPALDDIRKAALAHAEQELRWVYEKVRKVDHRLQRARTWPDQGVQGCTTNEVEALQGQRKDLLDRLAELVPRFGRANPSPQLRVIKYGFYG